MTKEAPQICTVCEFQVTIEYILTEYQIYLNIRVSHNRLETTAKMITILSRSSTSSNSSLPQNYKQKSKNHFKIYKTLNIL